MKRILSIIALSLGLAAATYYTASYALNTATDTAQTEQTGEGGNSYLERVFSKDASLFTIVIFAFLYGVLISFTPCVYPMIPITAAILQSQATSSNFFNFLLALFYVIGMALSYASLGLFVALGGGIFGTWISNPFFIAFIVAFFLYLAFAMFGFYEIYIPTFLMRRREVQVRGSLFYSLIAGAIAGTVSSPCLTPALATLLVYVATYGNPVVGFLTLFSFSLGMGSLLIIIGTSSAAIALLPRAGTWMIEVKRVFGFLLIGVCLYFMQFFFNWQVNLLLICLLVLTAALYYILSGKKECAVLLENIKKPGAAIACEVSYTKIVIGSLLLLVSLLVFAEAILVSYHISLLTLFSKLWGMK